MTSAAVRDIFTRFRETDPDPKTELDYGSPFELLIAVMLSAQATDKSVNLATKTLFKLAPTPEAMLELGEAGVIEHIKTIGLFRTKAKHVIETCRMLVEEHGGRVPDSREALEKLPGVGRKSANVVLNVAYRQPVIPVDTHIFRVANRTGLAALLRQLLADLDNVYFNIKSERHSFYQALLTGVLAGGWRWWVACS